VHAELQKKGGEVIAISTEAPEKTKAGHAKYTDIPFQIASDTKHNAIETLHLVHDNYGDIIAAPATIVIDEKGVVRWSHYAKLVTDRPDPGVVMEQVKKL
jgi:peroxiredoxin